MELCIIGAKDISVYVRKREAILVDLRNEDDYRDFHIRGAISVLAKHLSCFMKRSDKNRLYIFYCQHGSQSIQEGRIYARRGYRICSVAGGIEGYVRLLQNGRNL